MDIPKELKELTMEEFEIISKLVNHKQEIIDFANLAEDEIDKFLSRFRSSPKHANDSDASLSSKADFNDKINCLSRVLPKVEPNQHKIQRYVQMLHAIRKIRNAVAHDAGISTEAAKKLLKDNEIVAFMRDFPESGWKFIKEFRDYLASVSI
jgi:hypothetical protein